MRVALEEMPAHGLIVEGPASFSAQTQREPNVFANRYEVRGILGSGGMGTVYRTHDRVLDDAVALKLLRKELSASPAFVQRFRREVKLARRVTHRNIARVFDIGARGAQPFLTMELVDGLALSQLLTRSGKLAPAEVVAIAKGVCEGLEAAHDAGIIHRDLKPENVLLDRDGQPVITDFGVACALGEHDGPRRLGNVVGSPAYMAPEQVEDQPDLDARADVYALGVMLYELLTGKLPWDGGTAIAVAAARLLRPPPDPRKLEPELPDALAELVLGCMARQRSDRFASATDVARHLDDFRLLTATDAPSAHFAPATMRVPPLASLSGAVCIFPLVNEAGPEVAYFSSGWTSEVADLLGSAIGIQVRRDGGAFDSFDGARERARVLGASTVVVGSLRIRDGKLRLGVRLSTVDDGITLWSDDLEGASVVDFALTTTSAARKIARALGAAVPPFASVVDVRAEDLHLRGRFAYQRGWFEATAEAVPLLEDAYALDPRNPRIAATLALALARSYGVGGAGSAAAERARHLAESALEASGGLADARVALAALHIYDAEGVAAAKDLVRTLETSPDAVEALDWTGRLLAEVGDADGGIAYLDRAWALEPALTGARLTAALTRALVGEDDESTQSVREAFGPLPTDAADSTLYFFNRAPITIWRREVWSVAAQVADIASSSIPTPTQFALVTMLKIIETALVDDTGRALFEVMLPLEATTARRSVLNAQIRAELFAHAGQIAEAEAAVVHADANGLFDVLWLDRCPALDPLRKLGSFERVTKAAQTRARRILAVFERRT